MTHIGLPTKTTSFRFGRPAILAVGRGGARVKTRQCARQCDPCAIAAAACSDAQSSENDLIWLFDMYSDCRFVRPCARTSPHVHLHERNMCPCAGQGQRRSHCRSNARKLLARQRGTIGADVSGSPPHLQPVKRRDEVVRDPKLLEGVRDVVELLDLGPVAHARAEEGGTDTRRARTIAQVSVQFVQEE